MKGLVSIATPIAAVLILVNAVSAGQQPEVKRKTPRLTTEDVIREKPIDVLPASAAEAKDSKPAAKPDVEAVADKRQRPAEASAEESAWRETLKQAREKALATERAAEEAELKVTEIRNQLGVSGRSPAARNQAAADLDEAGRIVKQRRAEARQASDELNALIEEGSAKGYKENAGPKAVAEDGKPNEDYYRTRFGELNSAFEDAARKIQIYENRVREYNLRLQNNSKSGDNFYLAQLQQDRDEALRSLDEARASQEKAVSDIDSLKEQARAAGIPPGVFR